MQVFLVTLASRCENWTLFLDTVLSVVQESISEALKEGNKQESPLAGGNYNTVL